MSGVAFRAQPAVLRRRSGTFACSSFKQHALLEQMIVEGALYSKASCVVLVEAGRRERERETKQRAGRRKRRSVRAA